MKAIKRQSKNATSWLPKWEVTFDDAKTETVFARNAQEALENIVDWMTDRVVKIASDPLTKLYLAIIDNKGMRQGIFLTSDSLNNALENAQRFGTVVSIELKE